MIAAIRVRGSPGIDATTENALDRLGLGKVNSCVLFPDNESSRGQLHRVKDFITWGDLDEEGAKTLLNRADISTRRSLSDENVEDVTGYGSIDDLAADVATGDVTLSDAGLRRIVRLHPPRKGYKNIRRVYPDGSIGNRGDDVNELIRRMR